MKPAYFLPVLLVLLGAAVPAVQARPSSGFGLHFDLGAIKTTEEAGGATVLDGSVGGMLDYQFPVGNALSLNLAYSEISGAGETAAFPDVDFAKFGILGVHLRLWFGAVFLGVHADSYVLALASGTSVESTGGAVGGGLEAGLETRQGWVFGVNTDTVSGLSLSNGGPEVNASGGRVTVGYRWK